MMGAARWLFGATSANEMQPIQSLDELEAQGLDEDQ